MATAKNNTKKIEIEDATTIATDVEKAEVVEIEKKTAEKTKTLRAVVVAPFYDKEAKVTRLKDTEFEATSARINTLKRLGLVKVL